MGVGTILLIILIILLIGAVPSWPYSRNWGYGPSGVLGLILVILLIGFGVTLAHRPDKMIDEFGEEKGTPPAH